jgi:hypothetical protein
VFIWSTARARVNRRPTGAPENYLAMQL